jgi:pyruvate dehydrogenase E2 component (dihydrolipoamide acetyltransferase)
MAEAVLMMALSPTMDQGVIAEWIVKEGQAVKSGDVLCEVETDKATMAYEASSTGTLLKILKKAGTKATVGEPIAVIGKPGEDWQSVAGTGSMPEATKAQGARQSAGQVPEIPALPEKQAAPVSISSSVQRTSSTVAMPQAEGQPQEPTREPPRQDQPDGRGPVLRSGYPPSSPLARKKAAEAGLDLRALRGSGPHGRVVARDITEALETGSIPVAPSRAASPGAQASSGITGSHGQPGKAGTGIRSGLRDERVPLSRMRSIIAERLSTSYSTAPHFFVRAAVDMENLVALRASINAGRERGLGLNAFIMKLVASALERNPIINASWEGDAIRFRGSADIGLAVALEGGLITPVVRSCESLGIAAIDATLADLVPRARSGALTPQEYSEASFTISNLGSYGIEEFTAIINPPGSAILALGGMAEEAVVRDGTIVARRMMHITLSCDHRVIDGAAAAAFLAELKALMEEPAKALL